MNLLVKFCSLALVAILVVGSAQASEVDTADVIAAHNKWRAQVGITEQLSYSPALAKSAQAWVDHLKKKNHCQMQHSKPDGRYGENLYWASAVEWSNGRRELQTVSAAKVVDSWGSERDDYDYRTNHCLPGKMCGHYTQMVWRSTSTVGCAMAVCENTQEQVWACQYQPAGNWLGQKPY